MLNGLVGGGGEFRGVLIGEFGRVLIGLVGEEVNSEVNSEEC